MADARIDQLADAAKLAIQTAVGNDSNIKVECVDIPVIDPGDDWPQRTDGSYPPPFRWVQISAPAYANAGGATRAEEATFYTLVFTVVEYCLSPGPIPLEWRRERTAWVHEKIVTTLADAHNPLDGTAVPDTYEVVQNWDYVGEHKLFWCDVTINFLEHAE